MCPGPLTAVLSRPGAKNPLLKATLASCLHPAMEGIAFHVTVNENHTDFQGLLE